MPQASDFTSTCPAPGTGSGRLSTTISPPRKIAARINGPSTARGHSVTRSDRTEVVLNASARTRDGARRPAIQPKSGVGRAFGLNLQLRMPHALAMRGIETAGHDEARADHGPGIGNLAEHEKAEQADPEQLR